MNDFQNKLKGKMDNYILFVYQTTKDFPREELYGVVSQWRRSSLSVALNYIESYGRSKTLVRLNFLEISYGSLQESKYLLKISNKVNYLADEDFNKGNLMVEEIGAMLWTEIENLKKSKRN